MIIRSVLQGGLRVDLLSVRMSYELYYPKYSCCIIDEHVVSKYEYEHAFSQGDFHAYYACGILVSSWCRMTELPWPHVDQRKSVLMQIFTSTVLLAHVPNSQVVFPTAGVHPYCVKNSGSLEDAMASITALATNEEGMWCM